MTEIIEARGLVKKFGRVRALDGLDLSVSEGEVHGFLGPNGAGKSTTIRVLLGLMRASEGTASVLGLDPWTDLVKTHRDIAYVPGDVSLWPTLTGGEAVDLLAGLRGGVDDTLRAALIRDFELDPKKKARSYSKGNRQKVALVAAFARPAKLYILDEPTAGLDPVMESVFRRQIDRVKAEGATVLLSSHILSEVEELCDRVTIIRAGKTVETGTLSSMRHLTRTSFRVTTAADAASLANFAGVHDVRREADALVFDADTDQLALVLAGLTRLGLDDLRVSPTSLEELFLRHYSDAAPDVPVEVAG
jgi:ABC-2 type transport system ATP-binding protein